MRVTALGPFGSNEDVPWQYTGSHELTFSSEPREKWLHKLFSCPEKVVLEEPGLSPALCFSEMDNGREVCLGLENLGLNGKWVVTVSLGIQTAQSRASKSQGFHIFFKGERCIRIFER